MKNYKYHIYVYCGIILWPAVDAEPMTLTWKVEVTGYSPPLAQLYNIPFYSYIIFPSSWGGPKHILFLWYVQMLCEIQKVDIYCVYDGGHICNRFRWQILQFERIEWEPQLPPAHLIILHLDQLVNVGDPLYTVAEDKHCNNRVRGWRGGEGRGECVKGREGELTGVWGD